MQTNKTVLTDDDTGELQILMCNAVCPQSASRYCDPMSINDVFHLWRAPGRMCTSALAAYNTMSRDPKKRTTNILL